MDVTTTYGTTPTTATQTANDTVANPDGILDKDDFMMLLLTELKYQDPTDPMDTEKMLTQTSQLATLEASDNTNKALENLSRALEASSQFNTIAAIGKMGRLGEEGVLLGEEGEPAFSLYFGREVATGAITIKDRDGNVVRTLDIHDMPAGTHTFTWDGTDGRGDRLSPGLYRIEAAYTDPAGERFVSRYGSYPIESVRFSGGEAELKMGGHYVPISQVAEIYEG
ncbi:flagellar hook capping FlgD N-terminal domain-containing protein [Hydrogenimonas sp.]